MNSEPEEATDAAERLRAFLAFWAFGAAGLGLGVVLGSLCWLAQRVMGW